MPPLSENLADTLELALGANPATLEPADTTPVDSTLAASRAPQLILIDASICSTGTLGVNPEVRGPNGHPAPPHVTLDAKIYSRG